MYIILHLISLIQELRAKEKGDWKKMNIEEKKALYRASFCQTYAEMQAPTGLWKQHLGVSLMFISLAMWLFICAKLFGKKIMKKNSKSQKCEISFCLIIVNPNKYIITSLQFIHPCQKVSLWRIVRLCCVK